MPYIDKEKFRMHIIMYSYNPLKVKLTDKEKEKFIRMLDEVPTADVVERKKGKWKIYNTLDHAQRPSGRKVLGCPFCEYLSNDFMSIAEYYRVLTNFCPNCGADMREEIKDATN